MQMGDSDPGIVSEFTRDDRGMILYAIWMLTCAWCGRSERIDVRWHPPVSDARHGISTTCGWEIGHGLIVCPSCVEHDEWSRMFPTPSG